MSGKVILILINQKFSTHTTNEKYSTTHKSRTQWKSLSNSNEHNGNSNGKCEFI